MDLDRIQAALRDKDLDGWLFCDFHNRDPLALSILGMDPNSFMSRRWYFFVPREGTPQRLVSAVEQNKHESFPGEKRVYSSWRDLHRELKDILGEPKSIAMQYSPMNNIPYVSITDAGTVELVRSYGHTIVSSADLVQIFEALIDDPGFESHREAGKIIESIKDAAFAEIGRSVRENAGLNEYDIQQFIVRHFKENNLVNMGENPIVGIGDHPSDPHFEPSPENARVFKREDNVLIDLWAKFDRPGAIVFDVTWCGHVGPEPSAKYVEVFSIVRDARDAAVDFIDQRLRGGHSVYGWEVDDACRKVIVDRGYGEYFVHRTGHSIGEETHGNGANIDNLETKDERELLPGSLFSIEPGIYIRGEMGVRSEINAFIDPDRRVVVTGNRQQDLILVEV